MKHRTVAGVLVVLLAVSMSTVVAASSASAVSGTLPSGGITQQGWSLVPKDAAGLGPLASFESLVSNGDALLLAGTQQNGGGQRRVTIWRSRSTACTGPRARTHDSRSADGNRGRRRHGARGRRHRPRRRVGLRLAIRRRRRELDQGGERQRCVRRTRARDGSAQCQRVDSTRWMVGCVRWSFRRLRGYLGVARRSAMAPGSRPEPGWRSEHRAGPRRITARVRGSRRRGSRAIRRDGAHRRTSRFRTACM